MSSRSRIVLGSLAGAFAIHIAALACSGNSSLVGGPSDAATAGDGGVVDAIVSAVDAVVHDVAMKITDAEVRDAHAGGGQVIEVQCDQVSSTSYTQVTDGGTGSNGSSMTYWYGILPGRTVDLRTAPMISAYGCDAEVFTSTTPATCPTGYRCETTGFTYPTGNCGLASASAAGDGRVIVNCGFRSSTTTNGVTTNGGQRWRRAYVRIE